MSRSSVWVTLSERQEGEVKIKRGSIFNQKYSQEEAAT